MLGEKSEFGSIFVDFDRTLASTKSGGSPLQGNHTVDPDLLTLAASHPNFHIVTRNSHSDDIFVFLKSVGLKNMNVHCVGKGKSKTDVILNPKFLKQPEVESDEGSPSILFVDDQLRELSDPLLRTDSRVLRVLFVRGF